MKVSLLASGSKGNCCFVETKNNSFLIDAGMNCAYIDKELNTIGKTGKDIDSVFITHTHTDHINGLKVFVKKYNPIIYVSEKMYQELKNIVWSDNYVIIDKELIIDDLKITAIKTSHDADDSMGYIFEENGHSLVYITDTGYINERYFDLLFNKKMYIMESNHDVEMLMHGSYPSWLKKRIRGDEGHLSNNQCGFYLSKLIGPNTKEIALAHLSKENNSPELAMKTVHEELTENGVDFQNIIIAKQKERTDLIEI